MTEVDKLAHTQVANKGTDNELQQLVAKAMADGYPENYAIQIARNVQKRLKNTETNTKGHSTGVAHSPIDRYTAIKKRLGFQQGGYVSNNQFITERFDLPQEGGRTPKREIDRYGTLLGKAERDITANSGILT